MNNFRPIDYLDRLDPVPDKKTLKLLNKYSKKLQKLVVRMRKGGFKIDIK